VVLADLAPVEHGVEGRHLVHTDLSHVQHLMGPHSNQAYTLVA
jgi:hypothetical protein